MTALTAYLTTAASTTLTTANTIVTTSGAGNTNKNTQVGKGTGYGELYSQGTTAAWPGSGSIISADGNGWLWDDTTLADGSASFSAGTWTATVRLNLNANSIVANIHVRVYRRSSSGVYNTIVLLVSNTQTITSTLTDFTLSNTTTAASATFQPGDKLYVDVQLQITTNVTNSNTTVCKINIANSSTLGSTDAQIASPGYTTVTSAQKDAQTRFRLSSPTQLHFASMRFRLVSAASSILKDASIRFLLIGQRQKNASMRFRLLSSTGIMLFAQMRFKTKKSTQKDAAIRFRFSIYSHSALFPNATRRTGRLPNAIRRQTV